MAARNFWIELIEEGWKKKNVVWLSGVRRVGKTYLCRSLERTAYYDCELPTTRRVVEDPEEFLKANKGKRIVLDEIHRLDRPTELLKIAADYYPETRTLATGSSTLSVSKKFRDTLTGRKVEIWLTPMISQDLADFGSKDLKERFLRGGLPPFFISDNGIEKDYQEWLDAFWAKDIQELFRLERRHSFQKLLELLLAQSGGIFEATKFTRPCEASRGTITNYLSVLEATNLVSVIRPFSSHKSTEIISSPKVYGFDTGFICFCKGWTRLRNEDHGIMWEHYVLNELFAQLQTKKILYWRDKRGHEVDFVLPNKGRNPTAIECKWKERDLSASNLKAFRSRYPDGQNYVVTHDTEQIYNRKISGVNVTFTSLQGLISVLAPAQAR